MADFQRLFARYWVILTIALAAGAVVALALSLAKGTTYSATAALNIEDITQIEGSLGQTANSTEVPAQLAAASQRSVTSDPVLDRSVLSLPGETVTGLRDNVSASIDPASDLVLVTASAPTAQRAAAIANTVATVTAAQTNAQTRQSFAADAAQLAQQIATLPKTGAYNTIRHSDELNYSRLQTLAVIASPARIQQQADPPTSSSSNRTGFYVVLGALLGLILGLGVAFLRESLDRTVHAPEDVDASLQRPIIGHVDEQALGTAPYLDPTPTSKSRNAIDRFSILRRGVELLGGESAPHSVLVTSPGAEEGKSTVALSLACAFAAAGRRVALLEADLRRPTLAQRLNLSVDGGLADYLRGATTELTTHSVEIPSASSPLDVVLAGAPANGGGDPLYSRRLADAIDQLTRIADIVVIDGPPLVPVADALELVPLVDSYVVCLRAGRTKLAQLSATRQVLERLPARPGGVVITGVAKGSYQREGYDGYYRETAA
ncbi:MAG TPA: division plane positioning ATPase MipZ [Solirubrobacteraceae bacterium]|nr:division plane positioning ATPase MipZ [Solirubrobacteraceae bacterium]